ncbi:MAG: 50S ribosomal protein L21 [Henriciella sp.]|nr:50S ribosomal protein L21 [Henriciella sp.]
MFAVIKTGGKQYKVAEGDEIIIEKLVADAGDDVTFEDVLMLGDGDKVTIGEPTVSGASVVGKVAEQRKGAKVMIMKRRQRNTYRRKKGHRQLETVVTIESILADGKKAPAKKTAAKKAAPKKEAPAKAEAPKKAAPKKEAAPKAEAAKKTAPKSEAKADDLTVMKGLGKVFAEKLAGEGIITFAQIAKMKAADIAALEEKIGATGKFEKNDWVAQAKDLAK